MNVPDPEKPPSPSSAISTAEIPMCPYWRSRYVLRRHFHIRWHLFLLVLRVLTAILHSGQLLDICVKNCGYPFHLQISTKDFLNELVRRFPEKPPLRMSRVQMKILEAIEEWKSTICQTSRYKEDLGFIRDMHRLLLYKGYMFPEVRREDAAVLNPSDVSKIRPRRVCFRRGC